MKTDLKEKTAVTLSTKTVTIESKTVALPIENLDAMALKAMLREIGQSEGATISASATA